MSPKLSIAPLLIAAIFLPWAANAIADTQSCLIAGTVGLPWRSKLHSEELRVSYRTLETAVAKDGSFCIQKLPGGNDASTGPAKNTSNLVTVSYLSHEDPHNPVIVLFGWAAQNEQKVYLTTYSTASYLVCVSALTDPQVCSEFFAGPTSPELLSLSVHLGEKLSSDPRYFETGFKSDTSFDRLQNAAQARLREESQQKKEPAHNTSLALTPDFPATLPFQDFRSAWNFRDNKDTFTPKGSIRFLNNFEVFPELTENVSAREMVAAWFRSAYILARDPLRGAALFTREYRRRFMVNSSLTREPAVYRQQKQFFTEAWLLFRLYGQFGRGSDGADNAAYIALGSSYARYLEERDGTRILKTPQAEVIWKIEEGAWRLDEYRNLDEWWKKHSP